MEQGLKLESVSDVPYKQYAVVEFFVVKKYQWEASTVTSAVFMAVS
jgi:hypothetical protein